ncbi:MAG: GNAT family N-acetyltransferase [Bacillota bacterium]|nr:GNAT family N-acetyltransferase [Bacillota bacterium]
MIIRYASAEDTPEVKALWAQAFGDRQPYYDWYFRRVYRPERTLLGFSDGAAATMLQLAPRRLSLRGEPLNACYIVGVATAPAYRRRGYSHRLLRYALGELHHGNCAVALLNTDLDGFYEPLGFTPCYTLRPLLFPAKAGELGGWRETRAPNDGFLSGCAAVYQRMTAALDGYVLRSAGDLRRYIEDWLCDGGSLLLHQSAAAYLLWYADGDYCRLVEAGYADAAALRMALSAAQAVAARDGLRQLLWNAPLNAPLPPQPQPLTAHLWALRTDIEPELAAAEKAALTRELLNAGTRLWANEIC